MVQVAIHNWLYSNRVWYLDQRPFYGHICPTSTGISWYLACAINGATMPFYYDYGIEKTVSAAKEIVQSRIGACDSHRYKHVAVRERE